MDDPTLGRRPRLSRPRLLAGLALAPFVMVLIIAGMLYARSRGPGDFRPVPRNDSPATPISTDVSSTSPDIASSPVPAAAPTPFTTPGATLDEISAFQPSPPITAAFFYPWYPAQWKQGDISPFTIFRPTLGLYSSLDDAVIDAQLSMAAQAHIKAFISSWWGPGDATDVALQRLLQRTLRGDSPYPSLRWAAYYEREGTSDPTVAQIVDDLGYLTRTAFVDPAYLRINGRPVLFVYADPSDGAGMADRWAKAKAQFGQSLYVVLKVYPGYASDPNQPDSWHQYSPAVPYDSQLPYSVSVSPGFWKAGEAPRLARDPGRFTNDVHQMVSSGAFWQLFTSWNEWGEGTAVEPSAEYGDVYIDALCRNLPGAFLCAPGANSARSSAIEPSMTPLPAIQPGLPVAPARATPSRTTSRRPAVRSTIVPEPSGSTGAATSAATPLPATSTGGDTSSSPVIVAVGDIACGADTPSASCRQMDTSNLALQMNPDAVLVLGDDQYEKGQYSNFLDYFDQSWGRLRAKMHPAVGNHEYLTSGASGYFDYFDGIGASTGQAGERGKGYYSFDLGAWHLIAINSNCGPVGGCQVGSAQEQWLKADLAAHSTACSLMYMHHPLWSSDTREFELNELMPLYQDFYDAGGELVLTGHSHHYERFAPQNLTRNADPLHGVREIVIGTGGRNVYGFSPPRPNSEVRDGKSFGVLKLTLHPTSYDWQFVPVPGDTFTDAGSQSCH